MFQLRTEIFAIKNLQFQFCSNEKQQISRSKILSRNIVHLIDESNFWECRYIIFTYLNVCASFKHLTRKNMLISVLNENELVLTSVIWAQTRVINEVDFTYDRSNLQENHVESLRLRSLISIKERYLFMMNVCCATELMITEIANYIRRKNRRLIKILNIIIWASSNWRVSAVWMSIFERKIHELDHFSMKRFHEIKQHSIYENFDVKVIHFDWRRLEYFDWLLVRSYWYDELLYDWKRKSFFTSHMQCVQTIWENSRLRIINQMKNFQKIFINFSLNIFFLHQRSKIMLKSNMFFCKKRFETRMLSFFIR